ncbi:hypothetical protein MLD38_040779 [Melastoma candidum]|nr:hypothetical protein MLD38_040779 [Melastoma candidum]
MDFSEATSKVFDRIREVDPDNVTKIIGYLLLQEQGDKEMIRLAFGPDGFIHDAIEKAKRHLQHMALRSASSQMPPSHVMVPEHDACFLVANFRHFPAQFGVPSQYWLQPGMVPRNLSPEYVKYPDPGLPEMGSQGGRCFALDDPEFISEMHFLDGPREGSGHHHHLCLPDFPVKTCHYFNKGYCKHGNNCKYLHEQVLCEGYPSTHYEDHVYSPRSLEKLEVEIVEILKSRRGNPLSIASLPMIYYDNLTRLLSRLESICLIDRPHGQHAVILAEDAAKYMDSRNEKNDNGQVNSKSRQIYLTFPAESTFTEEDVSDYFNNFGQVEDVRIPCQHKRMFGFVTFVNSGTVNMILAKGNPHFVCGARVLVKPYKEKSKLIDRKYQDFDPPLHHLLHYTAMDAKFPSYPRGCRASKCFQNQLIEENERVLEYHRMRLAKLQLSRKHQGNPQYLVDSTDVLRSSDESSNLQSAECFNYLMDVLDSDGDGVGPSEPEYGNDHESQGIHLPESPFASQVDNSISTLT